MSATIYAESPITIDGQKYYFADGATTSMELGSSENVLNVALRKANNYNYSVTTNLGTTISEGICIEGDDVTDDEIQEYIDDARNELQMRCDICINCINLRYLSDDQFCSISNP